MLPQICIRCQKQHPYEAILYVGRIWLCKACLADILLLFDEVWPEYTVESIAREHRETPHL